MILVDTQRAHHFSTAGIGGIMNHVYLWESQSGSSHVASSCTLNAGMSNTLYDFLVVKSQQRASHYIAPFFIPCHPHPLLIYSLPPFALLGLIL